MKDVAASVRARLLNHARAQQLEFQSVLTRYGVERLVYRMAISPHADRFVLKGAQLLLVHAAEPHRPTKDLDLLGFGSDAVRAQHGRSFISAMPTNLFGPGDNFDLQSSHVLPALIREHPGAPSTQPNSSPV